MKVRSIKYNAIFNIIYTLSNIIFPLITFPYVSRVLNPEGVGVTNFFSSIGNYAVLVATLGMGTYGIRQVSKVRENKEELTKTTQELVIINLVMAIVVSLVLILSAFYVEKFSSEPMLLLITCISVFASVFSLGWLYSGLEQYDYITKRSILFKLISLVLIFIFVKNKEDYVIYAWITLFSTLGSNLLNLYYSRNYISFKLEKKLEFKKHIKPILYLFSSLLAVNIYTNLDSVMLGFISGDTAVGLYSVASKIKWLLLMLITSGSAVLLPRLSFYAGKDDKGKFNKILKDSTSIILMIAIPMSIYFIFGARDSIMLLGGNEFLSATLTMQILMPILIISGFSNITGNQILIPLNKEKYFMYAVTTGAVINLFLNIFLIPKYGITGAAVATLLAELSQMSVQAYFSRSYLKGNISLKTVLNIVIATMVSSIVLYLIKDFILINAFVNLVVRSSIFFCIYLAMLLLLKEESIITIFNSLKNVVLKKR